MQLSLGDVRDKWGEEVVALVAVLIRETVSISQCQVALEVVRCAIELDRLGTLSCCDAFGIF